MSQNQKCLIMMVIREKQPFFFSIGILSVILRYVKIKLDSEKKLMFYILKEFQICEGQNSPMPSFS